MEISGSRSGGGGGGRGMMSTGNQWSDPYLYQRQRASKIHMVLPHMYESDPGASSSGMLPFGQQRNDLSRVYRSWPQNQQHGYAPLPRYGSSSQHQHHRYAPYPTHGPLPRHREHQRVSGSLRGNNSGGSGNLSGYGRGGTSGGSNAPEG